jgi:hypothetical protein
MSLIWHAVNRNDLLSSSELRQEFRKFDVAHMSFNQHRGLISTLHGLTTKLLVYTYPAVLFRQERMSDGRMAVRESRSWLDYGNLFESVGEYSEARLPYLTQLNGHRVVDYPSTGARYWLNLDDMDLTPFREAIQRKMEQVYNVAPVDDNTLQAILYRFGKSVRSNQDRPYDIDRNEIIDDNELLFVTHHMGKRVSHFPLLGYLENYVEGFFIDNLPEYIHYTKYSRITPTQAARGFRKFCETLRAIIPHAKLIGNLYEGGPFEPSAVHSGSRFRYPEIAQSIVDSLDGFFFENWRWHWASRTGTLPPSTIEAIERRITQLVEQNKIVVLAVNLAYDQQGVEQREEAIRYALRRWGKSNIRFSEFRKLYRDNAVSLVERSRAIYREMLGE